MAPFFCADIFPAQRKTSAQLTFFGCYRSIPLSKVALRGIISALWSEAFIESSTPILIEPARRFVL